MTTVTALVPAEVVDTGIHDVTFLRYAPSFVSGQAWGFLARMSGAGGFNPFKAMQENDWSSPEWRWNLAIYQSDTRIMQSEVDYDPGANSLTSLFKGLDWVGDFTLLVAKEWLEALRGACQANNLALTIQEVTRPVRTSGN